MLVGQKGVKYGLSLPSKGGGGDGDDGDKDKDKDKRRPVASASGILNAFGDAADDDDEDDEGKGGDAAKRALQRDIALQAAKKASDAKVNEGRDEMARWAKKKGKKEEEISIDAPCSTSTPPPGQKKKS